MNIGRSVRHGVVPTTDFYDHWCTIEGDALRSTSPLYCSYILLEVVTYAD